MNCPETFFGTKGNRDTAINFVLNLFKNKSIGILEVGTTRNLDPYSRQADGWATAHFLNYINSYGGGLIITDISEESLANCQTLISEFDVAFEGKLKDKVLVLKNTGEKVLSEAKEKGGIEEICELVYLDGGDDPQEMVREFELISRRVVVFCDDFHKKGEALRLKYPEFCLFKWPGSDHEMALYNIPHLNNLVITCPIIQ